jgi:hypothetical protein
MIARTYVGVQVLDFSVAHGVQKTAPNPAGRDLDVEASQRFGLDE